MGRVFIFRDVKPRLRLHVDVFSSMCPCAMSARSVLFHGFWGFRVCVHLARSRRFPCYYGQWHCSEEEKYEDNPQYRIRRGLILVKRDRDEV